MDTDLQYPLEKYYLTRQTGVSSGKFTSEKENKVS